MLAVIHFQACTVIHYTTHAAGNELTATDSVLSRKVIANCCGDVDRCILNVVLHHAYDSLCNTAGTVGMWKKCGGEMRCLIS